MNLRSRFKGGRSRGRHGWIFGVWSFKEEDMRKWKGGLKGR